MTFFRVAFVDAERKGPVVNRRPMFLFPTELHISCVTLQLPLTSVSHFFMLPNKYLGEARLILAHRDYLQLFIHMVPEKSRVSFNDLMRSGVMAGGSLTVLQKEFVTLFFNDIWEAAFGEVCGLRGSLGYYRNPELGGGVKTALQDWEVNERSSPQATETENY